MPAAVTAFASGSAVRAAPRGDVRARTCGAARTLPWACAPRARSPRGSAGAAAGAAAGTEGGKRTPLWARAPVPVYAGCTYSTEVGRGNMNVVTYCTPLGLEAAPAFAVGVYRGTLTWVNMKARGALRLVPLGAQHASLVPLLGRACGRDVDKVEGARALGFGVGEEGGVPFLRGAGYVELVVREWRECGDHELAVCDVVGVVEGGEGGVALTTGMLREWGILPPVVL